MSIRLSCQRIDPVRLAASLLSASVLMLSAACTSLPEEPEARASALETNDPLQPFNRAMLDFNRAVDDAVLEPVARVYRRVLPAPARTAIGNALDNLSEPVTLMNDLLQGEFVRARETTVRFVFNSTLGLGGTVDLMGEIVYIVHQNDYN